MELSGTVGALRKLFRALVSPRSGIMNVVPTRCWACSTTVGRWERSILLLSPITDKVYRLHHPWLGRNEAPCLEAFWVAVEGGDVL